MAENAADQKSAKGEGKNPGAIETLPPQPEGSPIIGFLKRVSWRGLACVTIYFLGYFNFSMGWIITPLLLSAAREQWKKDKRARLAAAREAALTNEQAMIESRMKVDDLPSWVYFPDKERAEWVNSILKQLWPKVNEYVRKTLFETVEPLVKNILKDYKLKGFQFVRERVFLGRIPPRITGIKVYNEKLTSRQEIIMDIDLVFASDMEVTFSLKGLKANLSQVSLRGMLRVVLKPLISDIPLIGGVQVYFLSDPEIDYSLGGVAGALDVPGLSKIVENIISEQVRNFIVLPNKFCMALVDTIPKQDLICPNTAGVLRVTLMRAKELMMKDVAVFGRGSSDPYAILTVGATTYKTPAKKNNCEPEWNLTYDFPIEVVHGQQLLMEFFDEDDRKDDEFLGRATVQTGAIADRGHIEGFWVDLEECDSGKAQISLSWLPVTDDYKVVSEAGKNGDTDEHAKCILHIYIDSCQGLEDPKNPGYKPSPQVQISCAKDARSSWPKGYTVDPVVEQGFVMLVTSPTSDDIHIRVLDAGKKNDCLAEMSVSVWEIIQQPGMEYPLQPWGLQGSGQDAKITMSVSVRGLVSSKPAAQNRSTPLVPLVDSPMTKKDLMAKQTVSIDETVRAGTIKLTLHKACDLEDKDLRGKSDPYAVITYEDQETRTSTVKDTVDPEWNHEEIINIQEAGDNQIDIRLYDKDKLGKDEPLGTASIDVRRVSYAGTISLAWEILTNCKAGKILYSAQFTPAVVVSEPAASDDFTPSAPTNDTPANEPSTLSEPDYNAPAMDNPASSSEVDEPADEVQQFEKPESVPEITESGDLGYMKEDEEEHEEIVVICPPFAGRDEGFINVSLHKAVDLVDRDSIGKSDPYAIIRYGDHKAKSKVHKNNLNPEFNFNQSFVYLPGTSPLYLEVTLMDDDVGKDEFLGKVEIDISEVLEGDGEIREHWTNLEGVKSGKLQYSVHFSEMEITDFGERKESEEARRPSANNIIAAAISPALQIASPERFAEAASGDSGELRKRNVMGTNGKIRITLVYDHGPEELKVFIHEAAGLPGGDLPDPPDPYVKVYLMPGKKKKKKTEVVKDSGSPRFDEEFDFEIAFNKVQSSSLKISVVDKKGVFSKAPLLGTCTISLDNPGLSQGIADWYPLHHDDEDSD